MKNRTKIPKRLYFILASLFVLTALSVIVLSHFDDFRETENQPKAISEIPKKQTISDKTKAISSKKLVEKESFHSAENRKEPGNLKKDNANPQLTSDEYLETESIVEGVGISEKELKALHAKQRHEIDRMNRNMDTIVIAPSEEGGQGYTLGELMALHEQQKQAIANADDFDEIFIPASNVDFSGLSRSDLIELHKQQRLAIENSQAWDQIVIPASEDGYPGLTWDEVATLQELQADEILERAADPYSFAAPYPENGGSGMTVQEIKDVHMKQSVN